METIRSTVEDMLSSYFVWRKKSPLSEWQQERVALFVKLFWRYRSSQDCVVYIVNEPDGPLIFDNKENLEDYRDGMDCDCVAVTMSAMKGRDVGALEIRY